MKCVLHAFTACVKKLSSLSTEPKTVCVVIRRVKVLNVKITAPQNPAAFLLTANCLMMEEWVSKRREDLQNLTLVTTVFPFSDRCLSTYPDDSRSLGTERRWKNIIQERKFVIFIQVSLRYAWCLYFIGWLYSAAQSFRASAQLITTSVQGRGYFQHINSHKHNYTNTAF